MLTWLTVKLIYYLLCHDNFLISFHVALIKIKKKKNQQFSNSLPLTLSVSLSLWSNSYSLSLFYAQPPWQHDRNLLSEFLQCHYYSLPLPTVITPVVAKSKPSFVTSHSLTLTRFLSSIYQDRISKPLSVFELCISGI